MILNNSPETTIVPYITAKEIQLIAWLGLEELFPNNVPLPVPIDDIIEIKSGIQITFDSLPRDILARTEFENSRMVVSDHLNSKYLSQLFRSTIAHELGHFTFHRKIFESQPCFKTGMNIYQHHRARIEWQADYFGINLLMPLPLVLREWERVTGSSAPFSITEEREKNQQIEQEIRRQVERLGESFDRVFLDYQRDYSFKHMDINNEISKIFDVSCLESRKQLEAFGLFI
jgi:hypothetical protein